jgi:hypothetical protein
VVDTGLMMLGFSPFSESNLGAFRSTIWLFDIAMENGPFIDDFPIKTSIYKGFSMAMLNNQMVPPGIIQVIRSGFAGWDDLHVV